MIRIKQEPRVETIDIADDDPPAPLKQDLERDENTIDSSFSKMNSRFRGFVFTVKRLSDRMNQMDTLLSNESILECKRLLQEFQEILDRQILNTRDELNASTYEFESCLIEALKRPRNGSPGERAEKRRRITLSSDDVVCGPLSEIAVSAVQEPAPSVQISPLAESLTSSLDSGSSSNGANFGTSDESPTELQPLPRDHGLPASSDQSRIGGRDQQKSQGSIRSDRSDSEEAVESTRKRSRPKPSPAMSRRRGPRFQIKHSRGKTREELNEIVASDSGEESVPNFGLLPFHQGSMFPRARGGILKQIVLPPENCDEFITSREEKQKIYIWVGKSCKEIARAIMKRRNPIPLFFIDREDEGERIAYVGDFKIVKSSATIFAPTDGKRHNGRPVHMTIDLEFVRYKEDLHLAIQQG